MENEIRERTKLDDLEDGVYYVGKIFQISNAILEDVNYGFLPDIQKLLHVSDGYELISWWNKFDSDKEVKREIDKLHVFAELKTHCRWLMQKESDFADIIEEQIQKSINYTKKKQKG